MHTSCVKHANEMERTDALAKKTATNGAHSRRFATSVILVAYSHRFAASTFFLSNRPVHSVPGAAVGQVQG